MRASQDTKEEEVTAVAEDKTELTLVDREADVVGSDSCNVADLLLTCCPMVQKERKRETKTEAFLALKTSWQMLCFAYSARTSNIPCACACACNDTVGHRAILRLLFVNSTQLHLTTSNSHCGFRDTKKHPISFGKSTCQKIINGQSYCTLVMFLVGKCCCQLKNVKLQPGKFKMKVSKMASDTGKKNIKTMI